MEKRFRRGRINRLPYKSSSLQLYRKSRRDSLCSYYPRTSILKLQFLFALKPPMPFVAHTPFPQRRPPPIIELSHFLIIPFTPKPHSRGMSLYIVVKTAFVFLTAKSAKNSPQRNRKDFQLTLCSMVSLCAPSFCSFALLR